MSIFNLIFLFKLLLSLFFLIETYFFSTQILPIVLDKSFGDTNTVINSKINRKKVVAKSWFFLLFVISFFYGIYTIKSSENKYVNIFGFITGLILMLLFYYIPKRVVKNKYFEVFENITYEKVLNELKPSSLTASEIKEKFDFAIKNNYFDCELIDFENILNLGDPKIRIVWKPLIIRSQYKNRRLLLTFLNDLFQNQFNKRDNKNIIVQTVNRYFDFNEPNHKKENELSPNNYQKWFSN